jgi:hypothetical protein
MLSRIAKDLGHAEVLERLLEFQPRSVKQDLINNM